MSTRPTGIQRGLLDFDKAEMDSTKQQHQRQSADNQNHWFSITSVTKDIYKTMHETIRFTEGILEFLTLF